MSDSEWTNYDIDYGGGQNSTVPRPTPIQQPAGSSLTKFAILFLAVVVAVAGMAFGFRLAFKKELQRFNDHLVSEAFQQYKIVEQGDDAMAKSLHAGIVAEAFLMAKDGDSYHKWKKLSDDWDAVAKREIEAEVKAQMQRFSR